MALILLIGSGLMVKAFWKLQEVDVGMNPSHLLTMRLSPPSVTYKDAASINGFYARAGGAAERAAGVTTNYGITHNFVTRRRRAGEASMELAARVSLTSLEVVGK